MYAKKKNSAKVVALLLAVVLVCGCAVGGTLAWLMDTSDTVTNTFSVGNINIDLAETVKDGFKILPGTEQAKDPVVTVDGGSEDCWVFIQIQELNNVANTSESGGVTHKYVTWEIDTNYWTKLNESNGIITYYAKSKYKTVATDVQYNVLSGQKVSYGDSLTKAMIDKLYNEDGSIQADAQPQLIFKAFAVQAEAGDDAAAAWAQVPANEYLGATATP